MGAIKLWRALLDEKRVGLFEIYSIKEEDGRIKMKVMRCSDSECFSFGELTAREVASLLNGGGVAWACYKTQSRHVPRLAFEYYTKSARGIKNVMLRSAVKLLGDKYFRIRIRAYPGCQPKLYFVGPAFAR